MRIHQGTFGIAVAVACFVVGKTAPADSVDYMRQVKPILKARCYACHGALLQTAKVSPISTK